MTTTPTDEENIVSNGEQTITNQEAEIIDDPMIVEMKAAEKEIAEAEAAKGKEEAAQPAATDKPEDKADGNIMIPKARLDKVLSERDQYRDQATYLKGIVDANKGGAQAPAPSGEDKTAQTQATQEGSVDQIDAAIEAAEAKKLELAEKYDAGEISTKEWKAEEIKIDKEIRGLFDKRLDGVVKESKAHTDQVLNAAQQRDFIETTALEIQKNHPNIAAIDSLPEATSTVVWSAINAQAAANLRAQGVTLDNSPHAKIALIKEKAALTDQLTQENTAKLLLGQYAFVSPSAFKAAPVQNGQPQGGKQPSEHALNLAKKLDLANSQPPSTADMSRGTDRAELSDEAIAAMTEDQMADLLKAHPDLEKRIMARTAT